MKKLFAIMAAVVLCFSLMIPAFADEYNGISLPSLSTATESINFARSFIYKDSSEYYLVLYDAVGYVSSSGNVTPSSGHVTYRAAEGDSSWTLWGTDMFEAIQSPSIVWSNEVIYGKDGVTVLVDKGSIAEDVIIIDNSPVLPSVADGESMRGVMGEVLGMIGIVIPVVIGFIAVRKGIAWFFRRIRSA